MSFFDLLQEHPATELLQRFEQVETQDIDRALTRPKLSIDDFLCLLSPKISDSQLETLAGIAHRITSQRFHVGW